MGVYSNTIHGSYSDKIKAVYQHLDEIKKVADRLTPVEDVQVFQSQIEDIHSRLDVIVEASNVIVGTTEVGEAVITSTSWTALRELLGLEEFPSDVVYVHMLQQALDLLWSQINTLINNLSIDVPPSLINRLEQLELLGDSLIFDINSIRTDTTAFSNLVFGIQHTYSGLSGDVSFMQNTLSGMEASYSAFGNSLSSMAHNYTSILQQYENMETQVSTVTSGYNGLRSRMDIAEGNISIQSGHLVEVNSQLINLEAGVSANADALTELRTTLEYTDEGVLALATRITNLAASVEFDDVTGVATAISELSTRVTQNAQGIVAQSTRMDDLDSFILSEDYYLLSHASSVLDTKVGIINGQLSAQSSRVTTLENKIDRRNRTIIHPGVPTQDPQYPWVVGDMWIDSSNDNKLYTWGGLSGWHERELAGGVKTHVGPYPPAGSHRVGDLWFDESNDNKMMRWDGSMWVFAGDPRVTANSSAIETLKSTVNDTENGVVALAGKLTTLSGTVGDHTAQITDSMNVAVRSMRNNYIENPSFEVADPTPSFGADGWGSSVTGVGAFPSGFTRGGNPNTGAWALNIAAGTTGTLWNRAKMLVIPGNHVQIGCRYRLTSGSNPVNGTYRFVVRAYNSNGAFYDLLNTEPTFSDWKSQYQEHISYLTVPNNVYEIQVGIQVSYSASAAAIDDVYLRNMSAQEVEMVASHTLELDINGYVSGTRSMNDGVTSSFTVNADKFAVVKPGGGSRLEWSGGSLRVYDTSNELRIRIGLIS